MWLPYSVSLGDLSAQVVPSYINVFKSCIMKCTVLIISENDFSFEKKALSIDFLFKRIEEYIRIKEYYMREQPLYQSFTSLFPSNDQHFPTIPQDLPTDAQHSADKLPTLPDRWLTLPDRWPTLKRVKYAIPTNYQHQPVKSPTLLGQWRKVLGICREYAMRILRYVFPDKSPILESRAKVIPTNAQHLYEKPRNYGRKRLKVLVFCRRSRMNTSFGGFCRQIANTNSFARMNVFAICREGLCRQIPNT